MEVKDNIWLNKAILQLDIEVKNNKRKIAIINFAFDKIILVFAMPKYNNDKKFI